ncbi:MAG: hypothetical protein JW852_07515 [Spirochaetales bacterium]|nr:hypothetical protein [Spirochaetales bacterium]
MSGLYNKALHYLDAQRQLRLVRPEEMAGEEQLDVSADDREKILSQIDEIVDKNRIVVKPDTFHFHPKKKGGVLPFVFNFAALLVIAAGTYLLFDYFDKSEELIVTSQAGIQSAEGKLLAALKEESEQRLSEQEKAITAIQNRLEQMNNERQRLEANVEAQIRQREAELEASMMRELEAERARLKGEGLSESDIEERIANFEAEQQAAFEERLGAVRAEAQREIEKQRETLNRLTSEYEGALSAAQDEKSALQTEMTRQEAALLADFEQEKSVLESEKLDALQELASIRSQQEREQLVLDQILSFYTAVQTRLVASDLDGGLASLNELQAYLNRSDVISLAGVGKRRGVELFLIGSLKSLIEEQREAANPDTQSLIKSAQMLAAATDLIEQGNDRYLNADYARAKDLYISALTGIPAINTGYRRLIDMEEDMANEQAARIAAVTERADAAYFEGNYSRAISLYGEALDLMSPVNIDTDMLAKRLAGAGFQINRAGDLSTIRELQERVERQSAELEMLTALRAELNAELEALESEVAAGKVQLGRIPALQGEVADLSSRLQAESTLTSEQQDRIAFLNSEIDRLTARTEENARELLTLRTFKSGAENDRLARSALIEELGSVKDGYLSSAATGSQNVTPLSVLELLEMKLVLRRVVSSEPIKSEYPDFYDSIERYVESLLQEREAEARLSTLTSLNRLLDTVLSEGQSSTVEPQVPFQTTGERDMFLGLMDRLMKLLK